MLYFPLLQSVNSTMCFGLGLIAALHTVFTGHRYGSAPARTLLTRVMFKPVYQYIYINHFYQTASKYVKRKTGFCIARFSLSLNRTKMYSSGQEQVETCWHLCSVAAASHKICLFVLPRDTN